MTLTWHYKDADPAFGVFQAKELQLHLEHVLANLPAEVTTAPTGQYLVVRPWAVSKGLLVDAIRRGALDDWGWRGADFDFVLCFGDERTDESLFKALSPSNPNNAWPNTYTCVVGKKISRAKFWVDEPEEVMQACSILSRTTGGAPIAFAGAGAPGSGVPAAAGGGAGLKSRSADPSPAGSPKLAPSPLPPAATTMAAAAAMPAAAATAAAAAAVVATAAAEGAGRVVAGGAETNSKRRAEERGGRAGASSLSLAGAEPPPMPTKAAAAVTAAVAAAVTAAAPAAAASVTVAVAETAETKEAKDVKPN